MSSTPPAPNQRSIRLSLILYRALLVLYPAAFRRAYGAQMLQVFRDHCRRAALVGGLSGLLALWLPTLADLFRTALAERLEAIGPLWRPFLIRLCGLLMLISASFPVLLVIGVLGRYLFSLHLYLLPSWLTTLVGVGFSVGLPLYPIWGVVGLLLRQRTWPGWISGSLALLGLLLLLWNTPLYIRSFPIDASGAIEIVILTPHYLGLLVMPLGLLFCGLPVLRAKLLGRWSVVVLLLGLATGVQALPILWVWIEAFTGAPFTVLAGIPTFLQAVLVLGVFSWPLWAGLGYALWVKKAPPVAGPEPLAPSTLS